MEQIGGVEEHHLALLAFVADQASDSVPSFVQVPGPLAGEFHRTATRAETPPEMQIHFVEGADRKCVVRMSPRSLGGQRLESLAAQAADSQGPDRRDDRENEKQVDHATSLPALGGSVQPAGGALEGRGNQR